MRCGTDPSHVLIRRWPRWPAVLFATLPLLTACVSLTEDPRALIYEPPGIKVQVLNCAAAVAAARSFGTSQTAGDADTLDPEAIRILLWNIHKEGDAGWEEELARLAKGNDVLLLQEVTLLDPLQDVLQVAGLRWILASSFIYEDRDIGVLTATRVAPVANCTLRVVEPLIRIPKSAVISWLRLRGTLQTVAITNMHAINFTLTLGAYQAQLTALEDVLAEHRGPIVLAGDFNTWSAQRLDAVRKVAADLGLVEVTYADDRRALFFGRQADHVFVRGLDIVGSRATLVTSSDHNPIEVVLRVPH
jgi:endonuclease/exonuclease/phosphatase (EEP) superfamily protein YafD